MAFSAILWKQVLASPHPVRERMAYVRYEINMLHVQRNMGRVDAHVYHDQLEELEAKMSRLERLRGCRCGYDVGACEHGGCGR